MDEQAVLDTQHEPDKQEEEEVSGGEKEIPVQGL